MNPSFGRGFDSHRPLQVRKGYEGYGLALRGNFLTEAEIALGPLLVEAIRQDTWSVRRPGVMASQDAHLNRRPPQRKLRVARPGL